MTCCCVSEKTLEPDYYVGSQSRKHKDQIFVTHWQLWNFKINWLEKTWGHLWSGCATKSWAQTENDSLLSGKGCDKRNPTLQRPVCFGPCKYHFYRAAGPWPVRRFTSRHTPGCGIEAKAHLNTRTPASAALRPGRSWPECWKQVVLNYHRKRPHRLLAQLEIVFKGFSSLPVFQSFWSLLISLPLFQQVTTRTLTSNLGPRTVDGYTAQ